MSSIGFYGGVGSVTGANFMLEVGGTKFLIDCGLIQGERFALQANCEAFPYDPKAVHTLFVTHAHADHIGRIPKLVRDGFGGKIISTPATKDLASVMLKDAFRVMEAEAKQEGTTPCYDEGDVDDALRLWDSVPYHTDIPLPEEVTARFTDAGHILGSAMVHFSRGGKTCVFTGDIGNVPQPLLPPPEIPEGYQYMVMESVYGDRQHEAVEERSNELKHFIQETIRKGGTLLIPAFSLERTQGMLFEINNFIERGEIESIPVFLDSPLAIEVTSLYKKHVDSLKDEVKAQIKGGDDIFSFEGLSFTRTVRDSREIDTVKGAKIIIAGSGMSHGGRILRHEERYLGDSKSTVLLVGYQSVGTLGRLLLDGAKRVKLAGKNVKVRANIERIQGYSGHADRDQLVEFVAKGGEKAKQVFVAMGEERASLFLVQRLRDYLDVPAIAPHAGQVIPIDF